MLGLLKDHSGKVVAIIQLINKKVGGVGEPDEVSKTILKHIFDYFQIGKVERCPRNYRSSY